MRNIADKTDNISTLPAVEFNKSIMEELENSVTKAGIALDSPEGPDTDSEMLAQAISRTAQGASLYQDSGAADAYVLTAIGGYKQPAAYTDGMTVTFLAGNANTGASTVNVATIGVKTLSDATGSALTGGEIVANTFYTITFDLGGDKFLLQNATSLSFATNTESNVGTATDRSLTPANFGTQQSLIASGYQKLPGGLIIQWGNTGAIGANLGVNIVFPIAYPTAALALTYAVETDADGNGGNYNYRNLTTTGFRANFGLGDVGLSNASWISIGY